MKLFYKIEKGIGVLQNPQQMDISMCNKIDFDFADIKNAILELNRTTKIVLDENGKGSVSVKTIKKGTNTLRIIQNDENGTSIITCQPFAIFDYNDKIYSCLATALDVLAVVDKLQEKCIELEKRIQEIEKSSPNATKDKTNELVEIVNDIQYRLQELEKGYDPTI